MPDPGRWAVRVGHPGRGARESADGSQLECRREGDLVAPGPLGPVEGVVGAGDQLVGGLDAVVGRDPEGCGQWVVDPLDVQGAQLRADTFRPVGGGGRCRVGEDDDELVAPEARDEVTGP